MHQIQSRTALGKFTISRIKKGYKKTARETILLGFHNGTSRSSSSKSSLEGSIMLFKPQNTLILSFPTLSILKQSGMFTRRTISTLLSRQNALYSRSNIINCLKFAWYHEKWAVEGQKRIIWSDVTKCNMIGSDGRVYTLNNSFQTDQPPYCQAWRRK